MTRYIKTILSALLIAVAISPTFAGANETKDTKAIRDVLTRYEEALNAANTDAIVQLYTTDGVQMAPDFPAAVGRDAIAATYAGTFKAIALKLAFVVDEVKVLGKNSALLRSHSTGTLKVNGTDQPAGPAAFKELFVLNKQADGQWKFSHYSFSTAPAAKP